MTGNHVEQRYRESMSLAQPVSESGGGVLSPECATDEEISELQEYFGSQHRRSKFRVTSDSEGQVYDVHGLLLSH